MEPFIVEGDISAIVFTDMSAQTVTSEYQTWLQDTSIKKEIVNISFSAEGGVFALIVTYRTI